MRNVRSRVAIVIAALVASQSCGRRTAGSVARSARGAHAAAWHALGDARDEASDFDGAFAAYDRALERRPSDDIEGRLDDVLGKSRMRAALGEYQPAIDLAGLAYDLAARTTDHERHGEVIVYIAGLLLEMGDLGTSELFVAEADAIIDDDSPRRGAVLQLLGIIDQARGRTRLARSKLEASRRRAQATGNTSLADNTLLNLIDLALESGDGHAASALLAEVPTTEPADPNDRAARAYYRARVEIRLGKGADAVRTIERGLADAPEGWTALLEQTHGEALIAAGDPERAEGAFLRAVSELEAQRAALDVDTFKGWLLRQRRAPFEALFVLYVAQGRLEDAFSMVQRATARAMLDGLLRTELATGSSGITDAGTRAAGVRVLARALRASPAATPPSAAEILDRLGDRYVLTYFRAGRDLWLIATAPRAEPRAVRLGDSDEIEERAAELRRAPEDTILAAELGTLLLPAAMMPPAGVAIHVATDDPVADVPFAALQRDGEPLVARNPIAYVPSAAVLSLPRRETDARAPAVIVGDPTGDLPGSRREAEDVATLLGVYDRVGDAATRDAILGAGNASLLHVAAHAENTARGPALRLADGWLSAGDVLDQNVAPRVVVLTSCASASVRERTELEALASAFVAAGAHAVVGTRWAVDDEVSLRFSRAFYAAGGSRDPVVAVAKAQAQLRADGTAAAQWATFVVYGDAASEDSSKEQSR